jgi:predicted transcriptional regulator
MTDESKFPSLVRIFINDEMVNEEFLQDDPADHRGILSWHAQPEDGKLREAGSYGYLIETVVPDDLVRKIMKDKRIEITLEVPPAYPGGLAIYGKDFGRYPLDPTLLFISE